MTLGVCGFMLLVLSILAFRVMLEIFLVFFPLCFVAQSTSLRPIQSLTSGKGLPSRSVDRDALILRVACRKSCRNLEWGERFNMANPPDKIRESELGNRAKSLGSCLRGSPSTDVWAQDYGCF